MPLLPDTLENLEKGRVKELNLAPYTMEPDDIRAITELIPANHELKTIILGNCQFDRELTEEFAKQVCHHAPMVELIISKSEKVGDNGARAFSDILVPGHSLVALQLSECGIGDVGMRAIARTLKKNTELNSLDLTGNKIGDSGAEALADALKDNSTLARLRLDRNAIAYHGAKALIKALDGNQTLVEFTITQNKIDEATCGRLGNAFEDSCNIITLKVDGNRVMLPICDQNRKDAVELFKTLSHSDITDIPPDDMQEIKKRMAALVYVAQHELHIPRHRVLKLMKHAQKFLSDNAM